MHGSIDLVLGKQVAKWLKYVLAAEFELRRFKGRLPDVNADNPLNAVNAVKMRKKPGANISGDAGNGYVLHC
jgi:hypothetical protein